MGGGRHGGRVVDMTNIGRERSLSLIGQVKEFRFIHCGIGNHQKISLEEKL